MADARSPVNKEDSKQLLRRRLPQYAVAVAASMGGFALGCGLGWSASCVEILKSEYGYDVFSTNVVASAFPLGAAFGLFALPFLIDRIGRKGTMLVLAPAVVLGWITITCAVTVFCLVVIGRLVTGACGGMFCVIGPMYSAEISEKQIRGTLGVFYQLLLVIGILFAYCCSFIRSVVWTSTLCCVASIVSAIVILFVPESPLYYLIKGNEEAARKTMRSLRGPDWNIEGEMEAFKEQVKESKRQKVTIAAFLEKPVLKMMAITFGLMLGQQFSGINGIIFYAETIFAQTGVDMDPAVQMVIFAVVQVIACSIAALLTDKLGRKFLLTVSSGAMCLCLTLLGIFYFLRANDSEAADRLSWLPLTSACTFILAFCLGAGPIPWAYMGEIFPANLKGTASSGAAFFNWMLAFLVTMSFSTVVEAIGNAAIMFVCAVNCALFVLFILFFLVETKGKTFAEIQQAFGVSNAAGN